MYLYGASKPNIPPEIEQHLVNTIMAYFESRMFRNAPHNKWGILLVDNAKVELYIRSLDDSRPEWNIAELSEYKYFKEDIAKHMIIDKTRLNRVIGYIIMFKTIKMTFKYKDITHTRNKLGARCDSAGKHDIIDMLNKLIGRETYTNANTEGKLLHPHLCVILEMLLRDYTRGRKDGQIYYLTPEQSILNEITKYSTGSRGGGDHVGLGGLCVRGVGKRSSTTRNHGCHWCRWGIFRCRQNHWSENDFFFEYSSTTVTLTLCFVYEMKSSRNVGDFSSFHTNRTMIIASVIIRRIRKSTAHFVLVYLYYRIKM
jgi:hypothetical protein